MAMGFCGVLLLTSNTMKLIASVIAVAVLLAAWVGYLNLRTPTVTADARPAVAQSGPIADHSDSARLSQRMDDLQQTLAAILAQLAAQQRLLAAQKPTPAAASAPVDPE